MTDVDIHLKVGNPKVSIHCIIDLENIKYALLRDTEAAAQELPEVVRRAATAACQRLGIDFPVCSEGEGENPTPIFLSSVDIFAGDADPNDPVSSSKIHRLYKNLALQSKYRIWTATRKRSETAYKQSSATVQISLHILRIAGVLRCAEGASISCEGQRRIHPRKDFADEATSPPVPQPNERRVIIFFSGDSDFIPVLDTAATTAASLYGNNAVSFAVVAHHKGIDFQLRSWTQADSSRVFVSLQDAVKGASAAAVHFFRRSKFPNDESWATDIVEKLSESPMPVSLRLSKDDSLNDVCLKHLLDKLDPKDEKCRLDNLKELWIDHCPNIGDVSMAEIAILVTRAPALDEIHCSYTKISADGVAAVAKARTKALDVPPLYINASFNRKFGCTESALKTNHGIVLKSGGNVDMQWLEHPSIRVKVSGTVPHDRLAEARPPLHSPITSPLVRIGTWPQEHQPSVPVQTFSAESPTAVHPTKNHPRRGHNPSLPNPYRTEDTTGSMGGGYW